MAWRIFGDKPLPEPTITQFRDARGRRVLKGGQGD